MNAKTLSLIRANIEATGSSAQGAELLAYVDELREHLRLALDLTGCCDESTACVYLHGAKLLGGTP